MQSNKTSQMLDFIFSPSICLHHINMSFFFSFPNESKRDENIIEKQ